MCIRDRQEGWRVVEKKEKKAGDTGGTFSVCYIDVYKRQVSNIGNDK